MVIVTGSIEARPDAINRILELGLAHVQRSRQEPGCLLHSIHRDVENELRVVFIQQWEDTGALEVHFHVPESGEFVRASSCGRRPPWPADHPRCRSSKPSSLRFNIGLGRSGAVEFPALSAGID